MSGAPPDPSTGLPIEVVSYVDAPPAEVFRYFTEPDRYVKWQGNRADLDPRPGGRYLVEMDAGTVEGRFVAVEPPDRVVFTWGWRGNLQLPPGASTVEVRFAAEGRGTRVVLRHDDLPDGPIRSAHESGWRDYAGRLTAHLAAGPADRGRWPN